MQERGPNLWAKYRFTESQHHPLSINRNGSCQRICKLPATCHVAFHRPWTVCPWGIWSWNDKRLHASWSNPLPQLWRSARRNFGAFARILETQIETEVFQMRFMAAFLLQCIILPLGLLISPKIRHPLSPCTQRTYSKINLPQHNSAATCLHYGDRSHVGLPGLLLGKQIQKRHLSVCVYLHPNKPIWGCLQLNVGEETVEVLIQRNWRAILISLGGQSTFLLMLCYDTFSLKQD